MRNNWTICEITLHCNKIYLTDLVINNDVWMDLTLPISIISTNKKHDKTSESVNYTLSYQNVSSRG